MKITVKGTEIELKYGFKALMIYESITNKSFNPQGLTDMLILFYSCILASKDQPDLTFDEFLEFIDADPEVVTKFSDWFIQTMTVDQKLTTKDDKPKKPVKQPKN